MIQNQDLEAELSRAIEGDGFASTANLSTMGRKQGQQVSIDVEGYLGEAGRHLTALRTKMMDMEADYARKRSTALAEAQDKIARFDRDFDERMSKLRSMLAKLEVLING